MKRHNFTKCLLSGTVLIAAVAFQSCQSKPSVSRNHCPSKSNVDSSCDDRSGEPTNDCDKWKNQKDCNKGCKDEEANGEVMLHVIEIDQPNSPSICEEKGSEASKVEIPADAPVEASNVPVVEIAPEETANVVPSEESVKSAETVVLEEQLTEILHSPVIDSEVVNQQE